MSLPPSAAASCAWIFAETAAAARAAAVGSGPVVDAFAGGVIA